MPICQPQCPELKLYPKYSNGKVNLTLQMQKAKVPFGQVIKQKLFLRSNEDFKFLEWNHFDDFQDDFSVNKSVFLNLSTTESLL